MKYSIKENQENFYNLIKNNAIENNEVNFHFYEYENGNKSIKEITRSQLVDKSVGIAALLRKKGVKKGDRIIIIDTQTYDNPLCVAASILVGAIFTFVPNPIDKNKINRLLSVIKSCNPKFILCTNKSENMLNELLRSLKDNSKYKEYLKHIQLCNVDNYDEVVNFIPEGLKADDVIYLQYSSGSTSKPKAIMITYGNVLSTINGLNSLYKFKRNFGWVPFFHNMGLIVLIFMPIIMKDCTAGVLSASSFLENPIRWFEGISEFKAKLIISPNSVYASYPKLVSKDILLEKNINLSSVEKMVNGSEVINYETLEKFVNEYKEVGITMEKFLPGYGMSENTCAVGIVPNYSKKENLLIDFEAYKNGKLVMANKDTKKSMEYVPCANLLPDLELKVVNPETREECAADEFGELWIKSPCVAKGYYNNEVATKETFEGQLKDGSSNYLRTGDLGIIKNNNLYVTGRIKELIIVNGNNVLPNDIVVSLKENIIELEDATILPFSIEVDRRERLVIILAGNVNLINKINNEEIFTEINSCMLEYFQITPYKIEVANIRDIPTSDNGKISLISTAKLYNENKLLLINKVVMKQIDKKIVYNSVIEETLANIIKDEFKIIARRDENILSLDMDSLSIVRFDIKIEDKFKIRVPIGYIFMNPTIEKIGQYITRALNGDNLSALESKEIDLFNEVKLDKEIKVKEYVLKVPKVENIFLTGTTGFLGAYLIDNLIKLHPNCKIYCHVRAENEEGGFKRIEDNMKYYKLWQEEYRENIIPVIGSLDKPLLGISQKQYSYLTENIDIIYHNGAILNFLYPYENLKKTNVEGTINTIALACKGKAKYYNYISSHSVYDNPSYFNKVVMEDDELENYHGYYLSYSETKWVAEKIINLARKSGLRAAIYRPGDITGDTVNGIWKYGDFASRIVKSIMATGLCPEVDLNIHMTQVDYVASAIVKISERGDAYGKAYNLINPTKVPITWLGEIIRKNGYEVKYVSGEKWLEELFKSGTEHPLKALEELFRISKENSDEQITRRYGNIQAQYSTRNTEDMLKGTEIKCQAMNEKLISSYLNNFI